jgi:hypothetical protein
MKDMNKVTINVKDDQGKIIKSYDMEFVESATVQEFYEETRRVWPEYYVECEMGSCTMSRDFTYEQEMVMLSEEHSYKQFLTLAEI